MGRVLLVVVAVVGIWGMLEVGLRAFAPAHLAAGGSSRFELDPDVIYRLRPHNAVSWGTAEFTETSRTNALGMRGAEVEARRPGERRILAIGDSFTYGHGVQDDETYPAVLERRLRAHARDVTVQNAGVPGYSTDQAYTYFLLHGAELAPDLLLVGVHCSDISDNYESPLYEITDGKLVRRDARLSRMYRLGSMLGGIPALIQRSRVFDVVIASVDWHEPEDQRPSAADLDAWSRDKIRLEVLDLQARGAALHTTVAVVLMPCKDALAPDRPDPYGTLARDLPAAGVPVLDGPGALRATRADLWPLFFRDDAHLNVAGYAALADVVASFVEERELLAGRAAEGRIGLAD